MFLIIDKGNHNEIIGVIRIVFESLEQCIEYLGLSQSEHEDIEINKTFYINCIDNFYCILSVESYTNVQVRKSLDSAKL